MLKKIFTWWGFGVFGLFTLILAFILRVYHLTILPIFADEAIYIRWAQVMKAEQTLRFLPLSDGKPPLYMWTVIPFLKIFSDPLFAGRFVSVLCGMATLVGIVTLALFLYKSKRVALLTGIIYAIIPFGVFFDRMALADSMLSMFGVWTMLFAYLTVKYRRLDLAMLTGFTLGFAYLTKSPALFFLLLLPVWWLFTTWKKLPKVVLLTFVSVVISQVMFNILRLGPNFQLLSSRNYDYVYPISHFLANPIDPFWPHMRDIFDWINKLGPMVIWLFVVVGAIVGLRRNFKPTLIILACLLAPCLAQAEFAKVFTARYVFFVVPYLTLLASLVFLEKSRLTRVVTAFALLIFFFTAIKTDYLLITDPYKVNLPRNERSGYLEEWTAGQGIKETADNLRSQPESHIVVGTDGYFGTLPDGLQIYLNDLRYITIVGVGVKFMDVPKPLLESFKAGNNTYLLVNSSRFYIKDPINYGLKLISSYPKGTKPDGSHESLLFFQLVSLPSAVR